MFPTVKLIGSITCVFKKCLNKPWTSLGQALDKLWTSYGQAVNGYWTNVGQTGLFLEQAAKKLAFQRVSAG